jgi:hypothetical protein
MAGCAFWMDSSELDETAVFLVETSGLSTTNDQDDDSIADAHDGTDDIDGDGLLNFEDIDSDNDGILDEIEAGDLSIFTVPIDSDLDDVPDFLDTDSDNNCILDVDEAMLTFGLPWNSDYRDAPDYADPDNDGDGIFDDVEIEEGCVVTDTDKDGTPDHRDLDSDDDGVEDRFETGYDTDRDGIPNFRDHDSDSDGILDAIEAGGIPACFGPVDTDFDCIADYRDQDSDNDGLDDSEEYFTLGTDHRNADSDGDGASDLAETIAQTDPWDAADRPRYVETLIYLESRDVEVEALSMGYLSSALRIDVVGDDFGFVQTAVFDDETGVIQLNLYGARKEGAQEVAYPLSIRLMKGGHVLSSTSLIMIVAAAPPGTICIPN